MMEELLLIDYVEWQIWMKDGRYFYVSTDEDEERVEVEPIAELKYNVINDCLGTAQELDELFDNFCCGEVVDDNDIYYVWFKRVEE